MSTLIAQYRRYVLALRRLLCATSVASCFIILSHAVANAQIGGGQAVGSQDANVARYTEYNDALVRFRNRDYAGARQLLDLAKKNHAELPPSGVMMAQFFFAGNQTAAARATLEGVVKTDPNEPEAYLLFGELAIGERRVTDAELQYTRANQLGQHLTDPQRKRRTQARSLSGLARVAESRANWQEAVKNLRALSELSPDDVNARTRLARALFRMGGKQNEADAYGLYKAAYEKDNRLARAEVSMGQLYQQDKREANAEKLFNLAVQRYPNELKTRLAASQWALEAGNTSRAKQHARKAVQIDSSSLSANLLLGLVGRFDKDYQAAEAAFQTAHLNSPSNFAASNNLALSLIEQLDDVKRRRAQEYALMNTRAFSDLNQQNGREAAVTLAWILFRLGREAEADLALQKLTRAGAAVTPESAYFAARILQARGKADAATQILRPALQKNSVFPEREDAEELLARLPQS